MSKKDTVTKAFMRENTVFADAFNRIKQVPCFHCEKLAAAVQEVKKNAWYEKERLNMEEHLSTDTSDPISVIKDYIRSYLSDPDLGRTSITDKTHMNPDYLSHIFSTKTGVQKNRVSWDFFVPMHSVSFLTHKNPPDPLSDSSASSPDLSPGYSA